MTPETKARQQIDRKLEQAGWVIQDMKQLNLGLIFSNRRWSASASLQVEVGANKAFIWIAGATIGLLACALSVPAISRLFAFATCCSRA